MCKQLEREKSSIQYISRPQRRNIVVTYCEVHSKSSSVLQHSKYNIDDTVMRYICEKIRAQDLCCLRIKRRRSAGGMLRFFTPAQETAIVKRVLANNAIRLREIRESILANNDVFANIHSVRISRIDRILNKHSVSVKQTYKVPFQRKSDRNKEFRCTFAGTFRYTCN